MIKGDKKQIAYNSFILFSFLLGLLFYSIPSIGEAVYGQGIYPILRRIFDLLLSPINYSIALLAIVFFLYILIKALIKKGIVAALKFLVLLLALFYWLWGFNYYRIPLSEKMNLTFMPISDSTHLNLTMRTLEKCIELSEIIDESDFDSMNESLLKSSLQMADTLSFLAGSSKEAVPIYPPTLFLRIGILGMYFPYTGQAQYESELGPLDKPFSIAHEWCHAAGIAPEHEADFIAYLICISNEKPEIRYSANMHLLFELLFYYMINDPEMFESLIAQFTEKMNTQLEDRRMQYEKYSGVISEMSDEMIDNYLKFNQQEGIGDYHRLSEYVFAWENRLVHSE